MKQIVFSDQSAIITLENYADSSAQPTAFKHINGQIYLLTHQRVLGSGSDRWGWMSLSDAEILKYISTEKSIEAVSSAAEAVRKILTVGYCDAQGVLVFDGVKDFADWFIRNV